METLSLALSVCVRYHSIGFERLVLGQVIEQMMTPCRCLLSSVDVCLAAVNDTDLLVTLTEDITGWPLLIAFPEDAAAGQISY